MTYFSETKRKHSGSLIKQKSTNFNLDCLNYYMSFIMKLEHFFSFCNDHLFPEFILIELCRIKCAISSWDDIFLLWKYWKWCPHFLPLEAGARERLGLGWIRLGWGKERFHITSHPDASHSTICNSSLQCGVKDSRGILQMPCPVLFYLYFLAKPFPSSPLSCLKVSISLNLKTTWRKFLWGQGKNAD